MHAAFNLSVVIFILVLAGRAWLARSSSNLGISADCLTFLADCLGNAFDFSVVVV